MSELKSSIVYGVSIIGEYGEIDYDIANSISEIADKYENIEARWSGRDGNPPSMIVLGITLENYYEANGVNVNMKELLIKEDKAARLFPKEIINDIQSYLEEYDVDDIDFDSQPNSIMVHVED